MTAPACKSTERYREVRQRATKVARPVWLWLCAETISSVQDNPVFWLLIGPAPFAVMLTGLVFLRQQFSPKRMRKPLCHLESLEGARHGRVSALMIAIKAQAVGDDDSSLA